MDLLLSARSIGDYTVLEVGGEVDVYTAPTLREKIVSLVDGGSQAIIVDLTHVEFLDSTGLGGPCGRDEAAQGRGRRLRIGL